MSSSKKGKSLDELAKEIMQRQPMFIPNEPSWSGDPRKIMDDDLLDEAGEENKEKGNDKTG